MNEQICIFTCCHAAYCMVFVFMAQYSWITCRFGLALVLVHISCHGPKNWIIYNNLLLYAYLALNSTAS